MTEQRADQPTMPPKARGSGPLALIVILILVAGGLAAWSWYSKNQSPADPTQVVIAACEHSVKGQLKAPATAQFANEFAEVQNGNTWTAHGDVDAENSFSALIRTHWTCTAEMTPAGTSAWGTATLESVGN